MITILLYHICTITQVLYAPKRVHHFCNNRIIEIYDNYDIIFSGDNMEIKNITTLEELFTLWKKAQEAEDENSCKKTFPKINGMSPDYETFKNSFCPDGYISSEMKFNGILIICRESNVSVNEKIGEFEDTFAMKDSKEYMTVYYDFIKKVLKTLNELDASNNYTDKDAENCAYMNLNKRGGYGSTNHSRLANYAKLYEPFIKKEIELLSPQIVICGGTYGTVKDWLPENAMVLDCYHPSARGRFHIKRIKD